MIDFGILIALIISLMEVVKGFSLPKRFLPLISLMMGVLGALLILDYDIVTNVIYGLMMGLAASGLFDQSKILKK